MHSIAAKRDFVETMALIANPDTKQSRVVWFALTSFLSNAAMISKYVDPIGNGEITQRRREALREILTINNDSDILPRSARDNIEHFDERIDNWVGSDPNTIIELVFDTREEYEYMQGRRTRVKRAFIVENGVFLSEDRRGNIFELVVAPIYVEIRRICSLAEEWLKNESPYTFIYPQPPGS